MPLVIPETSVTISDMSESGILSHGEKLILLMLCEVYDHLKIDGKIDQDFIREAISTGNLWGLGGGFPEVFHNPPVSEAIRSETIDILVMWRRMEDSFANLTEQDRERVKSQEGGWSKFSGFDNNNEAAYISTARFLMEKLNGFPNFRDRSLDAHMETIETHRRMLEAFEPISRQVSNLDFSADQIAAVMLARIPPERRNSNA